MRGLVVWIFAASACAVARATPAELEAAFTRRLRRATSVAAADHLRGRFERTRVADLGCRWQRLRGLAPVACYEVLATETEWRIRSAPDARVRAAELDARCVRATSRLRVPAAEAADLRHVSRACATRVREALAIQAYRRSDDAWTGD